MDDVIVIGWTDSDFKISRALVKWLMVNLPVASCSYVPDTDIFIPRSSRKFPLILSYITARNNVDMTPENKQYSLNDLEKVLIWKQKHTCYGWYLMTILQ